MEKYSKIFSGLILLVFSSISQAQTTQPNTISASNGSKIVFGPATWYQPAENFRACRSRGIATIVGYSATVPIDQWFAALKTNSLTAWCQYTAETSAYLAAHPEYDNLILGWIALPDEPQGSGARTAGWMADEVRSIKIAWPKMRVMVNLDGRPLKYMTKADIAAYANCGADVIAFDIYPINTSDRPISDIGDCLDKLHAANPTIPILCCLEDCDQDLKASDWGKNITAAGGVMRGPALAEVTTEVYIATSRNCAGVIWFEQVIGAGWEKFYGVMPQIESAMPAINAGLMSPSPISFDGQEVTIDGVVYVLRRKS